MELWTSSGLFLWEKKWPPNLFVFFGPGNSKKTWRIATIFFFDFVEDWKEFLKVLGFTQSFIHFCFGPFCRLGMEQTLLHRVSNRFLVILSKVPDDTGPRKFIPSWVSQTIWPNSFFFYVLASNILYFHPYLGKISILTDIFSNGLVKNRQLVLVSFRLEVPMSCFSEQQKSIFQSWI